MSTDFVITDEPVGFEPKSAALGEHLSKPLYFFFSNLVESENLSRLSDFIKMAEDSPGEVTLRINFSALDAVADLEDLHERLDGSGLIDAGAKPEFEALRAEFSRAIARIDSIKYHDDAEPIEDGPQKEPKA